MLKEIEELISALSKDEEEKPKLDLGHGLNKFEDIIPPNL
jgi:hypothetical protein